MHHAYFRVSSRDQSIESQRHAMGRTFDREFVDEGVSGGVMAADRPGFAKLLEQVRAGDVVHVYAIDRLGRDALDVQATVRNLIRRKVGVHVHGIGTIEGPVAELVLAVLAQLGDMEKRRIAERTQAGREVARASLAATGLTHKGKASLGRPEAANPYEVVKWRRANKASILQTANHFGISTATVKRYASMLEPTANAGR